MCASIPRGATGTGSIGVDVLVFVGEGILHTLASSSAFINRESRLWSLELLLSLLSILTTLPFLHMDQHMTMLKKDVQNLPLQLLQI